MRVSKKTKENFEAEIKYLADEFFSIPKEDNSLISKRNTLKEKLWVAMWMYYKEIQYTGYEYDGEILAEKYSDVINCTIAKTMEAYKVEKGTPFLHYVNAAVKKEISRERQKDYLHGLKVPQKIFRQWKLLVHLAHVRGIDDSDINKLRELGFTFEISASLLEEVLEFGKIKITGVYEIIFAPLGGYKFILPFMVILAMLYGKRSIYLFEYSEELLNLPALPFSFDTSLFNRVLPALRLIEKEVAIPEAEFLNAIIDYAPSEHDLFMSFTEPIDGNRVTLSPLAYCFMKIDESKDIAMIGSRAKEQLAHIEGQPAAQAVKRIIKNSEAPTWRNVNIRQWKTGTDLSVLKCGSGERVACFIKKGIVHIVAIFSDHADYERTMPKISQASFENEIFTPCDFGDENFGSDDNNGAAVCEERNALQIKLKEIQAINETLQKENKNYNVEIELKEEYIESKEAEIESLKSSYDSSYNELEALKKEIQDLHSAQEQQKSFLYRLRHLFKY